MRFRISWTGKILLLLVCVKSVPKEPLMLEGKKGMRAWLILMTTTRMSLKMKRIKFCGIIGAGLREGVKGVVEDSEEIQDGKMGLTET